MDILTAAEKLMEAREAHALAFKGSVLEALEALAVGLPVPELTQEQHAAYAAAQRAEADYFEACNRVHANKGVAVQYPSVTLLMAKGW